MPNDVSPLLMQDTALFRPGATTAAHGLAGSAGHGSAGPAGHGSAGHGLVGSAAALGSRMAAAAATANSATMEVSLLRASMDAQPVAMALYSAECQAVFLNRAAHRLLRADPAAVTAHGNFGLVPSEQSHRHRYSALLASAVIGEPAEMPLPRGDGPPPYMVCFQPLEGRGALVSILDPGRRRLPSHSFLREAFGFTATEAGLALDLADGLAAVDCAALRGVSVHTVRSQLRALFIKTGLSRQAELVSLLLAMSVQQVATALAE